MGSHVAQASLELSTVAESDLELLIFLLNLPCSGVRVLPHHIWSMQCCGQNSGLPVFSASILPAERYPQPWVTSLFTTAGGIPTSQAAGYTPGQALAEAQVGRWAALRRSCQCVH